MAFEKLIDDANKCWDAFLNYGPVDDGRPEGDAFDEALMALRTSARKATHYTRDERAALVNIINAYERVGGDPCHFEIRDAINQAKAAMNETPMVLPNSKKENKKKVK